MKEKNLKVLCIVTGIIPFLWLLIYSVVTSIEYFSVANYLTEIALNLLAHPWVLVGLVLIVLGALMPFGNKEQKEKPVKNKKGLWIFLLVLGMIPFITPMVLVLVELIIKMSSSKSGGEYYTYLSYLIWTTYVIGGALIFLSCIKLKKNN